MSDIFSVDPNLPGWIRAHAKQYISSGGQEGHRWARPDGSGSISCLLLATKGRRSGEWRTRPLLYGESDGAYVVVASKAGTPHHPAWYLDIDADPNVQLMVGAEQFEATARTAQGVERDKLFALMAKEFSPYLDHTIRAAGTGRQIPIVVLDRK